MQLSASSKEDAASPGVGKVGEPHQAHSSRAGHRVSSLRVLPATVQQQKKEHRKKEKSPLGRCCLCVS